LNRHELFCNKEWVDKYGSEDASEFPGDYRDKIENGYSVAYYFVSTGMATEYEHVSAARLKHMA